MNKIPIFITMNTISAASPEPKLAGKFVPQFTIRWEIGWLKTLVDKIITHDSRVDQIRHSGLLFYCFYQIAYVFFLLVYSAIVPQYSHSFLGIFCVAVPINLATVYFSTRNFTLAGKVYLAINFLMTCSYLFLLRYTEALSNIAVVNFFSISIVALIVINSRWAVTFFLLGFTALVLDYSIYFKGDFGGSSGMVNVYDAVVLTGLNVACVFIYFVYILDSFIEYYKLYTRELGLRVVLNSKLVRSNESLNALNGELEKHVAALQEANERFEHYSWINSHNLRAPVARIMGLIAVRRLSGGGEHHDFIEDKILEAAEELDHVVSEMNSLLRDPRKDPAGIK
jgi:signal transduction histidine kinase